MSRFLISRRKSKTGWQVFLMMFFVLIPPYLIQTIYRYGVLDNVISTVSVLMIAWWLLKKGIHINTVLVILCFDYMLLIIFTWMNHGTLYTSFSKSLLTILLCLLLSNFRDSKEDLLVLLHFIRNFVIVLFILNIILTLVFPDGMESMSTAASAGWIYGNMNSTIKYIMPGLCSSMLIDVCEGKRMSKYTLIFIAGMLYLCFFVYFMATAFVGVSLLIAWILLKKQINRNCKLVFIIVCSVIFILEILLMSQSAQLMGAVSGILGKDLTFSGRVMLWTRAIRSISENPLVGVGLQSTENIHSVIGNSAGSHNYYLDILYQRGVLGLILFSIMILFIIIGMKWKEKLNDDQYVLLGVCSAYLLMFLAEPYYITEKFCIPVFYMLATSFGIKERIIRFKKNQYR